MLNHTIDSILPEAAAKSQDYIDGVIDGFHACAKDIALQRVMCDGEATVFVAEYMNGHPSMYVAERYQGWLAGYAVRRVRAYGPDNDC